MEAGIAPASAVRPIREVRHAQAHFYNWHAKGKCHRFRLLSLRLPDCTRSDGVVLVITVDPCLISHARGREE